MSGRLPEDFRQRTKHLAVETIRLFVKFPNTREEVRVVAKQLLRSGTSVAVHVREASRARLFDFYFLLSTFCLLFFNRFDFYFLLSAFCFLLFYAASPQSVVRGQ